MSDKNKMRETTSNNSTTKRLKLSTPESESCTLNSEDVKSIDKPTVFSGMLQNWPAFQWKTMEEWSEITKETELTFRISNNDDMLKPTPTWEGNAVKTVTSTIADFVHWQSKKRENLHAENKFKEFDNEINWCYSSYNHMKLVFSQPEILNSVNWSNFGFENRNGAQSTIWIGSKHAHTPCHQDTYGCNLVAQLIGRKLWVLFPPSETPNMYATRIPYEESSVYSQVNILNPDFKSFPKFSRVQPYCVVLNRGDALYVPPKWWHYVHSLEPSISVNTWVELESDHLNQLSEGVVMALATSLIPTYEPEGEKWINPNEELMPAIGTINVLKHLLNNVKDDPSTPSVNKPTCKIFDNATQVPKLTMEEFDSLLKKQGLSLEARYLNATKINWKDDIPNKEIDLRDIVNCFLHPNVISEITKQLRDLKHTQ